MATAYQAGQRVSEYVLEEPLGEGSFGVVWRARHHAWNDEQVAIKLPTAPEFVRDLRREGAVVHGLRHPNIVRMIGMDSYADPPYLVMELVRGPSLRRVLEQNPGGMPVPAVVVAVHGICRAIGAAHAARVMHRDLKPGNVLLDLEQRPLAGLRIEDVKVGDFGLGRDASTGPGAVLQSTSLQAENKIVGTLAYIAPELRDGGRPGDERGDLFSLGVMLFEMLTGERPAGTELPSSLRPEVPAPLDELFQRLYARHERRLPNAAAVVERLEAAFGAQHRPPRSPAPPPPIPQRAQISCPACRGVAQADDQFCIRCGWQLAARVPRCPKCLAYPAPQDRYCMFCGELLSMGSV